MPRAIKVWESLFRVPDMIDVSTAFASSTADAASDTTEGLFCSQCPLLVMRTHTDGKIRQQMPHTGKLRTENVRAHKLIKIVVSFSLR